MSDLVKREFDVLTANGSNYLSWSLDAEILLTGKNLLKRIKPKMDESSTPMEDAQALHFIRHHLSTTLKNEYMTERNPKVLWDSLHECFEQIESVLLPKWSVNGRTSTLKTTRLLRITIPHCMGLSRA